MIRYILREWLKSIGLCLRPVAPGPMFFVLRNFMANKFTVTVALPSLTAEEIGSDPANPEVTQRKLTASVDGTEVFNQTFAATLASVEVGSTDKPLLEGQTVHYELVNIDDAGNVSVAKTADNLVHDTTPPVAPGDLGFTANELP